MAISEGHVAECEAAASKHNVVQYCHRGGRGTRQGGSLCVYLRCQRHKKTLRYGGQWQLALTLLDSMAAPNVRSFNAALAACAAASQWQQALTLKQDHSVGNGAHGMQELFEAGLQPTEASYVSILKALKLWQELSKHGINLIGKLFSSGHSQKPLEIRSRHCLATMKVSKTIRGIWPMSYISH